MVPSSPQCHVFAGKVFYACDYVEFMETITICRKSKILQKYMYMYYTLGEIFLLWKYSCNTAFGNQTHSSYISISSMYTLDIL